ncbi:MAG: hypothetical protein BWY51_00494 [Parcubacteria group bacterium ADurb.Bin316]|nr:MAG: hypothetical protein BWY51_00494 [Parcubacteria group bacterium ADurb.Bin316]HOZ55924.1 L,D-transpeptidase family protein [bacterium]
MKKILFILVFCFLATPLSVLASADTDGDGINDKDEQEVYFTDPLKADTDGDGHNDKEELTNGYSPHNPKPVKLEDNDADNDGLSDRMELNFHTNLLNPDTDGDGYKDGEEIDNGYNPLSQEKEKLKKRIEINTTKQELSYWLGTVRMDIFKISSGKISTPTPKGRFVVDGKVPKAWSGNYGLWMPWFMSLKKGLFGIHELPVWPNGYREGENHLGTAVSHGCIRLGVGPAEKLYNWTPIGTEVIIN